MRKRTLLLLLLIISFQFLHAVSIRGNKVYIADGDVTFGLNDLVAVDLRENRFTEGIELSFTLPGEFIQYRDSFAVTIYSDLNRYPSSEIYSYTGRKIFFAVLPAVKKMYIDIPVRQDLKAASSFGTYVLDTVIKKDSFPLLIKIEPVMKGIPSSLLSKVFTLKLKKILSNEGAVSLKVDTGGKDSSYSVFIDGKQVKDIANIPLLISGFHQLSIKSEYFKEYNAKFAVKPGETTELNVALTPYNPTVQFDFPEGSKAFLDGKKLETPPGAKNSISPGEHMISISIGDYNISKKFTVKKDKFYKISLFLDIFIKEN